MEKPFQKLREIFPDNVEDKFIHEYLEESYLIHLKNGETLIPANSLNRSAYFIVEGSF